jgi:hypothetical protein
VATDLTSTERVPEPEAAAATPLVPPAVPLRPHRIRFGLVYGALAVVLGLAIAGVALFATDSITSGPAWSAWKPTGGGLGAAKQIAAHISPAYRLPDGNQIVDVIANGPVFASGTQKIPLPYVVVRGPKGKVLPDKIEQVSQGDTMTFSLCGLGTSCAIATGKPSVQRGTLVRREILELALYTFKYVRGVKHIVAFLPPPTGTNPTYAVYLQKDDLKDQLHLPLVRTLAPKVPLPTRIPAKEQQAVDAVLVLDPIQA